MCTVSLGKTLTLSEPAFLSIKWGLPYHQSSCHLLDSRVGLAQIK